MDEDDWEEIATLVVGTYVEHGSSRMEVAEGLQVLMDKVRVHLAVAEEALEVDDGDDDEGGSYVESITD